MTSIPSIDPLIARFWYDFELQRIKLPVLPDLAFKLHDLMSEANYDPAYVCQALSQEAGVAARLVGAANNVLNRGRVEIATLDMAVMRLGREQTQSIANAHLLKQLFHGSPGGKALLQSHWNDVQSKAIRATFLADLTDEIEPGEALLLTLLQGVGSLPLIAWMESQTDIDVSAEQFNALSACLSAVVGQRLLTHWQYSPQWIADVGQTGQWTHSSSDSALDRVDICLLASWAEMDLAGHPLPPLNDLPAYRKWQRADLPSEHGLGDMHSDEGEIRLSALNELLA